jgi:hypothetical protein
LSQIPPIVRLLLFSAGSFSHFFDFSRYAGSVTRDRHRIEGDEVVLDDVERDLAAADRALDERRDEVVSVVEQE